MASARFRTTILFSFGTALLLVATAQSSHIATFLDDKCKTSQNDLEGPNGYPNGTCTPLGKKGPYKSFQVVGLDDGCGGKWVVRSIAIFVFTTVATIYAKDSNPESPCSSTVLEIANIPTCYNTSWIYYSIDECTPPDQLSSTSSRASTSSSPTNTPTDTPLPQTSPTSHTGAIAGGIVGGVCGVALVVGLVFFFVRRNKNRQSSVPQQVSGTPLAELSHKDVKHEIYTHKDPVQEIGRNSLYMPAVELQGDEVQTKEDSSNKKQ
jgi:LPXTG-motif cell wall-anchored protein